MQQRPPLKEMRRNIVRTVALAKNAEEGAGSGIRSGPSIAK